MITTDSQEELFPLVDENDNVIGKTTRRMAHSDSKLIHRAVDVLIYNAHGELLLQKRSKTKDTFPDSWSVSASGHIEYGDTYEEAAAREVFEETGIQIDTRKLKVLGKTLTKMDWESEFSQVYEYRLEEDVALTFDTREISELKFFGIEEIKTMLEDKTVSWDEFTRDLFKKFPL